MKYFLTVSLLFISQLGFSQYRFNKTYTNQSLARANAIIQGSKGDFISAGTAANGSVMYGNKVNYEGDSVWTLTQEIGVGGANMAFSVIEVRDENYIIAGLSRDLSDTASAGFLLKVNDSGSVVWKKKYFAPNSKRLDFNMVKETHDKKLAVIAWKYNTTITECNFNLLKLDSSGNLLWSKEYGGNKYDYGNAFDFTSEGGYILGGTTYSYGSGLYSMYLVKTDSLGNKIWDKTYGGPLQDYGVNVMRDNDDNYLMVGGTYITADTLAAYIVKTDSSGTVIWERKYKGPFEISEFTSIKQTSTGEYIVCGHYQAAPLNNRFHGWVMKLNPNTGDTVWTRSYKYYTEDSTQHYFYGMDLTQDNGIVMCGMVLDNRKNAQYGNQVWIVKADSLGNDTGAVGITEFPEAHEPGSFYLFPNPAGETATVKYFLTSVDNAELRIFDMQGRLLQSFPLDGQQAACTFSTSGFNSGIYLYTIRERQKTHPLKKMVIIR
jgi:hypothetical protein